MIIVVTLAGAVAAFVLYRVMFARPRRPRRSPSEVLSDPDAGRDARRIWNKMKRLAQPTLLLAPAVAPGFSKMGGDPELPSGAVWPIGPDGPLGFLVQLDLAEMHASRGPPWLPATGAIYAFHDERWGSADQVRIVHAPDGPYVSLTPPEELDKAWRYPERRVDFLTITSLPSLDWLDEDVREIDVDDYELDALADAPNEAFGDELQHRVGGYPAEIQDAQMAVASEFASRGVEWNHREPVPTAIARASKTWRLLLQIDSDPALKMSWADAGRFYVFVREADAMKGDFSKTVTISQSH